VTDGDYVDDVADVADVDDVADVAARYQQTVRSATTVLTNLAEIESAIGELQRRIGELPLFARGFVSSQVTKGTGQDIPAWSKTVTTLTSVLGQVREAADRPGAGDAPAPASVEPSPDDQALYAAARERVDGDRPRLERLATFMESVPSKLGAVPPGLLPPDQRAEFLDAIAQQTRALRGALAEMPALSDQLLAISAELLAFEARA